MLKRLLNFIRSRMGEASTIRNLIGVITLVTGVIVKPELTEAIVVFTLAIHQVLGVVLPDKVSSAETSPKGS